jgi:hypothetical protein
MIASRFPFKPLEIERFKRGIAQLLPQPQKFDGAASPHPVVDDCKWILRVAKASNVR